MKRWPLRAAIAALTLGLLLAPGPASGWGENALRLVANKAVETLPEEMKPFFEANRQFIVQHVSDPIAAADKDPGERQNQFIRLDHYGSFPFSSLPRDYKAAAAKFTRQKLTSYGLLPWQVGVSSQKLTDSFRDRNWQGVRENAASLAFYVAEAHDPFNTTMNEDGKLSGQPGANVRFNVALVDRYSLFFFIRPNEASLIHDPTEHAFDLCLSAHAWLENILIADRRSRAGLPEYNDEYYDRFYSQAGAILVRQITDGATDIGSYWMTAWINAGRPPLPPR